MNGEIITIVTIYTRSKKVFIIQTTCDNPVSCQMTMQVNYVFHEA